MENSVVRSATLKEHAEDYREKAQKILKVPPRWIEGDPESRSKEYLELAAYFDRLATL